MNGDIGSLLAAHHGVMSARQLEEVTGVPQKTYYDLAKHGRIPSIKIGAKVGFDPVHVAAWWHEKEMPTIPTKRKRVA